MGLIAQRKPAYQSQRLAITMIRIDYRENELRCDGYDFNRKFYSKNTNPIVFEQERSQTQLKHECSGNKIVAPPLMLDEHWKEFWKDIQI
jgi:hypothetical protein